MKRALRCIQIWKDVFQSISEWNNCYKWGLTKFVSLRKEWFDVRIMTRTFHKQNWRKLLNGAWIFASCCSRFRRVRLLFICIHAKWEVTAQPTTQSYETPLSNRIWFLNYSEITLWGLAYFEFLKWEVNFSILLRCTWNFWNEVSANSNWKQEIAQWNFPEEYVSAAEWHSENVIIKWSKPQLSQTLRSPNTLVEAFELYTCSNIATQYVSRAQIIDKLSVSTQHDKICMFRHAKYLWNSMLLLWYHADTGS